MDLPTGPGRAGIKTAPDNLPVLRRGGTGVEATMSDRKVRRRQFLQASATAAAGFVIVKSGSVYGSPANDAVTLGIIGCRGGGNHVGQEKGGAGGPAGGPHALF